MRRSVLVSSRPARGDEERVLGAADELRSRLADVAGEPVRGLLAERDDALLAALAADVDGLLLVVDVHEVEPNGFAAPQSGRVDELEQRAVPSPSSPSPWAASSSASTSSARGVTGSRRCRLGANEPSGTRAGPSSWRRNERIDASFLPIVDGASRRRSRPSSAA